MGETYKIKANFKQQKKQPKKKKKKKKEIQASNA